MASPLAWYYNSYTGAVDELPVGVGFVELHSGLGWHGPFDTKQAALDFYTANKNANPGWHAPAGWLDNLTAPLDAAGNAIKAPITDVTGAITAAVNTLAKLSLRVTEAAAGIVLLAIAVNVILKQLTGVDVAGSAVRAGKKAGKVAATAAVV